MRVSKRKINKYKLLWLLGDIMLIIGIVGLIFNQGRIYQNKKDQELIELYQTSYNKLVNEFKEYKQNSYVLYGKEYYQENGLLPK